MITLPEISVKESDLKSVLNLSAKLLWFVVLYYLLLIVCLCVLPVWSMLGPVFNVGVPLD